MKTLEFRCWLLTRKIFSIFLLLLLFLSTDNDSWFVRFSHSRFSCSHISEFPSKVSECFHGRLRGWFVLNKPCRSYVVINSALHLFMQKLINVDFNLYFFLLCRTSKKSSLTWFFFFWRQVNNYSSKNGKSLRRWWSDISISIINIFQLPMSQKSR